MTLFDLGKPNRAPLREVDSFRFLEKWTIEVTLVCGHKKTHRGSRHPTRFRCGECRKAATHQKDGEA
jgi:hypothetical protein